ncbi:hypothetical protein E1H18_4744 [Caulobacter sp. RHG1]|nr:hypothetical protein [Caulobacter sp. RHG1]
MEEKPRATNARHARSRGVRRAIRSVDDKATSAMSARYASRSQTW